MGKNIFSKRVENLNPSLTLSLVKKAKELKSRGKEVIELSVGEPDFPTPSPIKEAGIKAIREDKTKYTPASGIDELKEAIIENYKKEQGFKFEKDEVIVNPGSKFSLFSSILALVNPDEKVLIPSPYWVSYPEMVKIAEGKMVFSSYWDGKKFEYKYSMFEKEFKKGIKLMILNSPSNPTGTVIKETELKKILEASIEYDFYILFDECYRKIIYTDFPHPSPLKLLPEAKDKILIMGSLSKTYSMTGWRIGYTLGPKKIIRYISMIQSHSTSNPPTISQYAAIEALKGSDEEVSKMVETYKKRRELVYELLSSIPGVKTYLPEGAFYFFPNIEKAIKGKFSSSFEFAEYLLNNFYTVIVPGEGFGAPGFIRISYATSEENIIKGIENIKKALRI